MNKKRLVKKVSKEIIIEVFGNKNFLPSFFSVPFYVKEKLEIPTYEVQGNVENLNSWLKELEVYFGLYLIKGT